MAWPWGAKELMSRRLLFRCQKEELKEKSLGNSVVDEDVEGEKETLKRKRRL